MDIQRSEAVPKTEKGSEKMIQEFELGDIAECYGCGKEFEMNNLDEKNINDFDIYFDHVTTCEFVAKKGGFE